MENFEALNMHQKLRFLHNLYQRIELNLPRRDFSHINLIDASDLELLRMNQFFRSMAWANGYENAHQLEPIYKKLYPEKNIKLPDQMRCKSVIILLTVHLFNQYYPNLDIDRIIRLLSTALQIWESLKPVEIEHLNSVIDFSDKNKELTFKFQDQIFHCQLNPKNGYGYELTYKN
tara:strand:- start:114 stop:638 length:525 start_codon:yes stop_codon:yes gene_type:complete